VRVLVPETTQFLIEQAKDIVALASTGRTRHPPAY